MSHGDENYFPRLGVQASPTLFLKIQIGPENGDPENMFPLLIN